MKKAINYARDKIEEYSGKYPHFKSVMRNYIKSKRRSGLLSSANDLLFVKVLELLQ